MNYEQLPVIFFYVAYGIERTQSEFIPNWSFGCFDMCTVREAGTTPHASLLTPHALKKTALECW